MLCNLEGRGFADRQRRVRDRRPDKHGDSAKDTCEKNFHEQKN